MDGSHIVFFPLPFLSSSISISVTLSSVLRHDFHFCSFAIQTESHMFNDFKMGFYWYDFDGYWLDWVNAISHAIFLSLLHSFGNVTCLYRTHALTNVINFEKRYEWRDSNQIMYVAEMNWQVSLYTHTRHKTASHQIPISICQLIDRTITNWKGFAWNINSGENADFYIIEYAYLYSVCRLWARICTINIWRLVFRWLVKINYEDIFSKEHNKILYFFVWSLK